MGDLDPCLCFTMWRSNTRALWIGATRLPPLSDVIVRRVASTKNMPAKEFPVIDSHMNLSHLVNSLL